jgi:hypothetical protein
MGSFTHIQNEYNPDLVLKDIFLVVMKAYAGYHIYLRLPLVMLLLL